MQTFDSFCRGESRGLRRRRRGDSIPVCAEVQHLEARQLLSGIVVAADDYIGVTHDDSMSGNVLYNDWGQWGYDDGHMGEEAILTATLTTGPLHGTLVLTSEG